MQRARLRGSGKSAAAARLAGLGLAFAPALAWADQLVLQGETAKVALEPYAAPATVGSRAQLSASLGGLDTSLTAAVERGGGGMTVGADAWTEVYSPSSWISDDLKLGANLALSPDTRLILEAGDRERWAHNFTNPLASTPDEQLAIDGARYLRLRAETQGKALGLQLGAESLTSQLETRTLGAQASSATRLWITSQRLFARLSWRPTAKITLEGGEQAQNFAAGWRGEDVAGVRSAYLIPSVALTVSPWSDASWRLEAEETLSPIDPAKFAAYAQAATSGAGAGPQPDHGWRYGLRLEHLLPGGIKLNAQADDWRLRSVTELGPVGAGEAPVGIGPAQRQQVAVNLEAPLSGLGFSRLGLGDATLSGEVSLRRSEVQDPFTGQRRPISGDAPYGAKLSLAGALPHRDLSWSLTAQADGPQSLYELAQVTSLGPIAGLGGALTYGAGPLKLSLEVDNLVGGTRDMTTMSYAGSRAQESLSSISRRRDDARAVRIALRKGL